MRDTALPPVSIVILNYNGKHHLKECFESLYKLDYPKSKYEVIMGDNASSDDSVKYVRTNFPWVKIVKFDKNYGFCKSNNEIAKTSQGEYLVFLNNDTIVTEDWLKNFVTPLTQKKEVLSAGCKMLKSYEINGKEVIDYAGGKISPDGGGMYIGMLDKDKREYNLKKYTGFGCGAGVIVNKKFFLNTGGFDEYYFAGYEEMDLGLRVWKYGYKVLYVPNSVMYHKRLGTFGSHFNLDMLARNTKNRFYFILKNFEIKIIFIFLFWAVLKCFFEMFYFVLKGKRDISIAIIKGMIWFLKDIKNEKALKRILEERKKMNRNKKVSDNVLFEYGIISTIREKMEYGKYYLQVAKDD